MSDNTYILLFSAGKYDRRDAEAYDGDCTTFTKAELDSGTVLGDVMVISASELMTDINDFDNERKDDDLWFYENFVTYVTAAKDKPDAKELDRAKRIIELARDQHHSEGSVEVDDFDELMNPADAVGKVSEGDDNGAYVMAWVWVDFAGTGLDKENDNEH